jgi:hypothetical protein
LNVVNISLSSRPVTWPTPFHLPSFGHRNKIWRGVQIVKLVITHFSPVSCYFLSSRSFCSPHHAVLKNPLGFLFP